ncbi:hypothetical protein RJD38_19240 [Vibrio scophthalmi]|uniref:Uncharacterized protein n=1 Tax=Vibrio scophthalmi TaxID=45658 RepID=A0A1C7FG82_9VIBR|nr:hypothetical protein [Vibrio scophthalmi]ANU38344.1 hypothetical protein VSVS05_03306 [Vibrio scophthalmi]
MQELLIIVQIGIFIYAIVAYFSNQNNKALLEEQKAKLLSTQRDSELSDEERNAIFELLELEATSSEVYYITEQFEVHSIAAEDNNGEEAYFLALADYLVIMPEKAFNYLDLETTFAEVVLADNVMIVISLNDYSIVDDVNNTLAEAPIQESSEELSPSDQTAVHDANDQTSSPISNTESVTAKQTVTSALNEQVSNTIKPETQSQGDRAPRASHRDVDPISHTVLKSERPATLIESRYLSAPFYNFLVPILLVIATAIFSHINKLDFTIEPVWLSAAILVVISLVTLLLLKRQGPTADPASMVVNRYFGKVEAIDTTGNKTWIVFIAPNGEATKAWIPSQWQNNITLNRDVQFEIEQSQSAVVRIGLNELSDQDAIKKKPQYLAAAMGLLLGCFFIAANTKFEWRDASLAMLDNSTSYKINGPYDWPTSELKVGDRLSITQPRLCLDSHDKNNAAAYCKQFEYALTSEDLQVTPDAAPIKAYQLFITTQPDFTPDVSEELYSYMVKVAKMQKQFSPDGFKLRIRHRSEMMMFTVESLQAIATHFAPYCPIETSKPDESIDKSNANDNSIHNERLNTACSDFKQEFALLWNEATSSSCDTIQCWNEALQGIVVDHDAALRNTDDIGGYRADLRHLKDEVWQATKATLSPTKPQQASITLDWSGERSADLYEIATLRASLDQGNSDKRIERLNKLLPLQTTAAQQVVDVTILNLSNEDNKVALTVTQKLTTKQALSTIINLGIMAFFGLLIVLLIIAYMLSGKPRKEKQVKSEDAWIS